jgi:hypothetical protein
VDGDRPPRRVGHLVFGERYQSSALLSLLSGCSHAL